MAALAGLTLMTFGCAAAGRVRQPTPAPAPFVQPQIPSLASASRPEAAPTDGSLFAASRAADLFADDKAFRRGDIVLVRVIQNSSGTKKANTDTSRNMSLSANIKYFLGLEKDINKLTDYTNVNADGTD
ncbi:MAG: flagellar basal body L-ring protein FlgH, partial [bacterium]|nr:flagellar basal body L-ring protein FlgH [bacterium]